MTAQDLPDGGAAQLGARRSNPDKAWWSCSRPTSGTGMTWCGVWYGQRGDGCRRRMRSPPWMPCKRPPERRAQWVHNVPTTGSWPSGSHTHRSMAWRRKPAGTCSNFGDWGIRGPSSGGQYQRCVHWKRWDGSQSSYGQGLEMRKMGHVSGGGTPLRMSGGAQEFREGV